MTRRDVYIARNNSSTQAIEAIKKFGVKFENREKYVASIKALAIKFYLWTTKDDEDQLRINRQAVIKSAIESIGIDPEITNSDEILKLGDKLLKYVNTNG